MHRRRGRSFFLSRLLIAGICLAAAAGWAGVTLEPLPEISVPALGGDGAYVMLDRAPGVRDRLAWQPSPIPSNGAPAYPPATSVEASVRHEALVQQATDDAGRLPPPVGLPSFPHLPFSSFPSVPPLP